MALTSCGGKSQTDSWEQGESTDGGSETSAGGSEARSDGRGGDGAAPTGGSDSTSGLEILPHAGSECESIASLTCDSSSPQVRLICSEERTWDIIAVCGAGEICDSRAESSSRGSCVSIDPDCEGRGEGMAYCDGYRAISCHGVGLIDAAEDCLTGCQDGVCGTFADACGTEGEFFDCAEDCSSGSDVATCPTKSGTVFQLQEGVETYVVRVPSYAAAPPLEDMYCGSRRHGVWVMGGRVRVQTPNDWGVLDDLEDPCVEELSSCRILSGTFYLYTRTTEAQARNITIEVVDETAVCP
jgi:hypothetical protein